MKTRTSTANPGPKQDMSFHLKPKIIHYNRPDSRGWQHSDSRSASPRDKPVSLVAIRPIQAGFALSFASVGLFWAEHANWTWN